MALRRACNQSRCLQLRKEFFQRLSRSLQRDGLSGVSLVGFEMDVVEGRPDELVRGFGR